MVIIAPQEMQNGPNAKLQVLNPTLPADPVIVQRMGRISFDEPPPYDPRQSHQPLSSSSLTLSPTSTLASTPILSRNSTLTSSSQPLPQQSTNLQLVPPVPRRAASSPALHDRLPIVPPPRHPTPIKRDILATNYLFLQTRKELIQDTFHIDPDLPMVELDKNGKLSINRQIYNKEHKQKHRHHNKKNKNLKNRVPNAIFQSKTGDISLNLALVAQPLAASSNALIQAYSKKGNIDIKIPLINASRRLNLEVATRCGNILILIPRSFSGYIQIYSKEGKIVFLPHMSGTMNIVSRRDREMQVMVGDAMYHLPKQGEDWTGDTIHVASRQGHIYIGYNNEDRKPIEETGFWKRVFDSMVDVLLK